MPDEAQHAMPIKRAADNLNLANTQKENETLKRTIQEMKLQQQETGQRMRDSNSLHNDVHRANCESLIQTIVNLTDANAKLRAQIEKRNESIRNSFSE